MERDRKSARLDAEKHAAGPVRDAGVHVGMQVVGSDGERSGRVKEVRAHDFLVDRPKAIDMYVPLTVVQRVDSNRVVLTVTADRVDEVGRSKAMEKTGFASATPKASQDE